MSATKDGHSLTELASLDNVELLNETLLGFPSSLSLLPGARTFDYARRGPGKSRGQSR